MPENELFDQCLGQDMQDLSKDADPGAALTEFGPVSVPWPTA